MGFWKNLRAVLAHPDIVSELETYRMTCQQFNRALAATENEWAKSDTDAFLLEQELECAVTQVDACQAALRAMCSSPPTTEELKRIYEAAAPVRDPYRLDLYFSAKTLTGIEISSYFPYEDNLGLFEDAKGPTLLRYLIAARFGAVSWEIVPGTCHEKAVLGKVDITTPEYQAFEKQLYEKVLSRMGFENMLAPETAAIESKVTELKLYSPLTADIYMEPEPDSQERADGTELMTDLYGEDLTEYQKIILESIESELLPEMKERGLMFAFSGSESLGEKVLSLFPSVEEVDGVLCGAAVCRIKGTLTPAELTELKEFCTSQYANAWGEGFVQCPQHTEDGELYVNFWQDDSFSILTKEELEAAKAASRPPRQPKRGGDAR